MIGWLNLSDDQRRESIGLTELESGISPKVIEKDWYVTLVLRALFLTKYARFMAFKGGTSLSKGWKLIARFSEDIDIALDPQAFGIEYIEKPSESYLRKLRREGCQFTTTILKEELENELNELGVPSGVLTVQSDPVPENIPDLDPQTIRVKYRSQYDPNPYFLDEVKIEISVRSMLAPSIGAEMKSILSEFTPNAAYLETAVLIKTVLPRKTFMEKMFLLHEDFTRATFRKMKAERKSRHLYDLFKISQTTVLDEVLNDRELYHTLIQHRGWYNRLNNLDYNSLARTTISFIPTGEVLEAFRKDYSEMLDHMIYENNPPTFEEIITHLKTVQEQVRAS